LLELIIPYVLYLIQVKMSKLKMSEHFIKTVTCQMKGYGNHGRQNYHHNYNDFKAML